MRTWSMLVLFFLFLIFTLFPFQVSMYLYSELTLFTQQIHAIIYYAPSLAKCRRFTKLNKMWPGLRSSYRSVGQKKLTRVQCDKCWLQGFRIFQMSDSTLMRGMTEVCLAFICRHPYHETSFHAFFIFSISTLCFCYLICSLRVPHFRSPQRSWHLLWFTPFPTG